MRHAVLGGGGAATGFDAGLHDGQAETRAAGVAGAVGLDAVEGVEDAVEVRGGHAGAEVGDEDDGGGAFAASGDGDGAVVASVTEGVAEEVGKGALEQLGAGEAGEVGGDFDDDFAFVGGLALGGAFVGSAS